jgi:pyruvate dehydrogenase phosphatase
MNARPGLSFTTKLEDFLGRNLTPPYISNHADVRHVDTSALEATTLRLIMCSDGLVDLYTPEALQVNDLADVWVQLLAKKEASEDNGNLAICLLRDALGGNDQERISRMMTVEMCYRWMDDTTIVVQKI